MCDREKDKEGGREKSTVFDDFLTEQQPKRLEISEQKQLVYVIATVCVRVSVSGIEIYFANRLVKLEIDVDVVPLNEFRNLFLCPNVES